MNNIMDATNVEKFGKQLAFDYLINQLRHEKGFSKTGEFYASEIIDILDGFSDSLEELIFKAIPLPLQKNLKEVYEIVTGKEKHSVKNIETAARKIRCYKKQLERLMIENTESVYSSEDFSGLLRFCEKVREFYEY